ncbi:MAG: TIGR01459 family HAD-type hydrolase [Hyphomicrobium sp.]
MTDRRTLETTSTGHSGRAEHALGTSAAPPIITAAGPLLARYDVLFCDVWGVVHDGLDAFVDACAALTRFRANGGTVILVSNAPVPKRRVADMLASRNVPEDAWDDIVSSGAIALDHIAARGFKRLHYIGPQDRDQAFFKNLSAEHVHLSDAEAIVCTGMNDDRRERPGDYRPLLEKALALRQPFICANPDLVVDVGGTLLYCAGAIADIYAQMGGEVFWAGKPYLNAYEAAHTRAEALRNRNVARQQCLVIGDAIRTDLKGAENFGCDALFVASGIHRHDAMDGPALSADKLAALFPAGTPSAVAAMDQLRW